MDRTPRLPTIVVCACLGAAGFVVAGCGEDVVPPPTLISQGGLLGRYYADVSLEEAATAGKVPDFIRLDPSIDFPSARADFGTEVPSGRYAVQWVGYIAVPDESAGLRGLALLALGRTALAVDGSVIVAPQTESGYVDVRRPLHLSPGWHHIELWYENADEGTHTVRFGFLGGENELLPFVGGETGIAREQLPATALAPRCEPVELRISAATVRVVADSIASFHVGTGSSEATSDAPVNQFVAELTNLEAGQEVQVSVTATGLDGRQESGGCTFQMPEMPVLVEGTWRAEYFENTELAEPRGVRYDPALSFPSGLAYDSEETEWFPGVGAYTFSTRWTAWYLADDHTTLEFRLTTDDGSRLLVDGREVIDLWREVGEDTQTAELGPGYHTITVEYYQTYGRSYAGLTIRRQTGSGFEALDPTELHGELVEPGEDAPDVSAFGQDFLNNDDYAYDQWLGAGCSDQGLWVALDQPATLEVDGEITLLSPDTAATAFLFCLNPGSATTARLRMHGLNGLTSEWQTIELDRGEPIPE